MSQGTPWCPAPTTTRNQGHVRPPAHPQAPLPSQHLPALKEGHGARTVSFTHCTASFTSSRALSDAGPSAFGSGAVPAHRPPGPPPASPSSAHTRQHPCCPPVQPWPGQESPSSPASTELFILSERCFPCIYFIYLFILIPRVLHNYLKCQHLRACGFDPTQRSNPEQSAGGPSQLSPALGCLSHRAGCQRGCVLLLPAPRPHPRASS